MASQQAEIDQLKLLLQEAEDRAVQVPSTENHSSDRLTDVLEVLAQRLTRADSPAVSTKLAKLLDPPIFTNGKDPEFDS